MLDKSLAVFWNEIEHDLYEENGYAFGIQIDLFNDHQIYYCKSIQDGVETYRYLDEDMLNAIDQFNSVLEECKIKF